MQNGNYKKKSTLVRNRLDSVGANMATGDQRKKVEILEAFWTSERPSQRPQQGTGWENRIKRIKRSNITTSLRVKKPERDLRTPLEGGRATGCQKRKPPGGGGGWENGVKGSYV